MSKIDEAKEILRDLGLPIAQQNEISALTLLGLCGIKKRDQWSKASKESKTITKGIMQFVNEHYKKSKPYAPNTRETFRKDVLHQFLQAGIVDYNPDGKLAINSPKAHYALSNEALYAIQRFGTRDWKKETKRFKEAKGDLSATYSKARNRTLLPLVFGDGNEISLSFGRHNELEIAIIKEFAPRFAEGGFPLYIGDTAKKEMYIDRDTLKKLDIVLDSHSKLPDVIIYVKEKNWLYLIEAVSSTGPISPKRIIELEALLKNCQAGKIYITAFPDFKEFKKYSSEIAWETEVWIVENPDHLIHFNGDRFVGPR